MEYRWSLFPPDELTADYLSKSLGISKIVAQCLINRGIRDKEYGKVFLRPELKRLSNPFLLPDMSKAVERLFNTFEREESVVIFGDYDVDGVTSTVLLYDLLRKFGFDVNYYFPNRMEEGYGLNSESVNKCLRKFPTRLIIAVDCGTSAFEVIKKLKQNNIDVIVLDHHQISSEIPPTIALVNPFVHRNSNDRDKPENSQFTELCSVGIVFKLAHAFIKRARELGIKKAFDVDIRNYLDLVALGTIADMVPLVGENRILATAGLKMLNTNPRAGLKSLISVSATRSKIGAHEVGFQLAPRLNATGRLETAEDALQLLLAESPDESLLLAQRLDAKNRERQMIEHRIFEDVFKIVLDKFNPEKDYVIVEGNPDWHIGVVGIVASKIVQQFYRPTIIMGGDGVYLRGSGRSIDGFDIAKALCKCRDLLIKCGGHSMAAGVTIKHSNLNKLRERLNEFAKQELTREDLSSDIMIDAKIKLSELSFEVMDEIEHLKPFGSGNRQIQLLSTGLKHYRPLLRIGSERQHIKMWVTDGNVVFEAILWNGGDSPLPTGKFDLVFTPQINEYNQKISIVLNVIGWRSSSND